MGVTQAEVDTSQVDNSVSVAGTPARGTLPAATDTHTVMIVASPALTVVKAATTTPTEAGDTVDYSFTVVNTGNVSISVVTITDDKCATTPALDSESMSSNNVLEVGETHVWSCTSVAVTQTEVDAEKVDNDVSVSGTPAAGTLTPATDDHSTPIAGAPNWQVTKAVTRSTTPSPWSTPGT